MVNPPHLIIVLQRAGLGDHPAHGHRQACGGDHQQHIVDVVGRIEVAEALGADDGIQGDLIQGADDLDDGGGQGEQSGAVEKILLFLSVRHRKLPFVGLVLRKL